MIMKKRGRSGLVTLLLCGVLFFLLAYGLSGCGGDDYFYHSWIDYNKRCEVIGRVVDTNYVPVPNQPVYLMAASSYFAEEGYGFEPACSGCGVVREVRTDQDGRFRMVLAGVEANVPSGEYPATFVLKVEDEYEPDKNPRLYTGNFSFRNDYLVWDFLDLPLWNNQTITVDAENRRFEISWAPVPEADKASATLAIWHYWYQRLTVEDDSLSLPCLLLPQDQATFDWGIRVDTYRFTYVSANKTFDNCNNANFLEGAVARTWGGEAISTLTDGNLHGQCRVHEDVTWLEKEYSDISFEMYWQSPKRVFDFMLYKSILNPNWNCTLEMMTSMDDLNYQAWDPPETYSTLVDFGPMKHVNTYIFSNPEGSKCMFIKINISCEAPIQEYCITEMAAYGESL